MHFLSVLLLAGAAPACPVQSAVLADLAEATASQYVIAENGNLLAAQIRAWRSQNRYVADCNDDDAFVQRLNRDLDAYDGHFHVEKATDPAGDDWLLAWRKGAQVANAGVREVAILEGNIGYVRISSFYPWDIARPKYLAAWQLVSDAAGLVIDLRGNGGGDAMTPSQVVRSALGNDVQSVQSIDSRGTRKIDPLPAAELPALRTDMQIIVLIDRRSGSAAEFVAYSLQMEKRAEIVGSRSGGAAHMLDEPVRLRHGFQVGIPSARPINRISGSNWEGVGVKPDVSGGDDALFVARRRLLDR